MILTPEQELIRDSMRAFAQERLAPFAAEWDRNHTFPREALNELAELGALGMVVPEEWGGAGMDYMSLVLTLEEIAAGDGATSTIVSVQNSLPCGIINRFGNDAQKEAWLKPLARGEKLGCFCLTEPHVGSDASAIRTSAVREGNEWVLNGVKQFITSGKHGDVMVVIAVTDKAAGKKGISAFLVPMDLPGIQRTRFNDVGSKIIGRGSVFFDEVRVPAENMMGAEGKGFTQVMQGFDFSRILIALQCVAAAQASIDETWEYVKERQTFGAPLAQYQGVSFPLVEFETLIAACRQLCYHGLALRDAGQPHTAEAAMVKWMGPKTAFDAIHQCLLTFGHYGWSMDLPHQQRLRDVMGLEIGDGTAQIMKLIVARERVGRAAVQYAKESKK